LISSASDIRIKLYSTFQIYFFFCQSYHRLCQSSPRCHLQIIPSSYRNFNSQLYGYCLRNPAMTYSLYGFGCPPILCTTSITIKSFISDGISPLSLYWGDDETHFLVNSGSGYGSGWERASQHQAAAQRENCGEYLRVSDTLMRPNRLDSVYHVILQTPNLPILVWIAATLQTRFPRHGIHGVLRHWRGSHPSWATARRAGRSLPASFKGRSCCWARSASNFNGRLAGPRNSRTNALLRSKSQFFDEREWTY